MRQEDVRFLILTVIYTFALLGAAALLTGCSYSIKELECIARDNSRNPCN